MQLLSLDQANWSWLPKFRIKPKHFFSLSLEDDSTQVLSYLAKRAVTWNPHAEEDELETILPLSFKAKFD